MVFKLDTSGNETVLYTFTGGADGGNPYAGVIRDSAGNLYGTTDARRHRARAWCTSWIRPAMRRCCTPSRVGPMADSPSVCRSDSAGNLYGTTYKGGACGERRAWCSRSTRSGHETVLYSFTGGNDGGYPGAVCSATRPATSTELPPVAGHQARAWCSKLDTSGHETVLYSFTGGADGAAPMQA